MTRHFYTDPLAAAWMAKHFGMRFHTGGDDMCVITVDFCFNRYGEDFTSIGGKLYIHPDSLHLLDPVPGDIVFYDNGHGGEGWDEFKCLIESDDLRYPYAGSGEPIMLLDSGETPCRSRLRRIIQRNGLAFHWPESEAA